MNVIKNENIIFFDVDDTLLLFNEELMPRKGKRNRVMIRNPYSKCLVSAVKHDANIALLREKLSRGYHVVIWSLSGYAWAESAARALNLEHENLIIMNKPMAYVDDLQIEEWLPKRIYLDAKVRYKA